MRKVFKGTLPILVMVVGIFGLVSLAQASFWVKGVGFYYSPDYGDIGDGLEKAAPAYDTPKVLGSGSGATLSAGYDFSENWGIRLDTFSFTGIADYHRLTGTHTLLFETSTSSVLVSAVYRVPVEGKLYPYFGAGIGIFPSELTITPEGWDIYKPVHWTDSPLGFQVLWGVEYRLRSGLFFSGEVRYISAKAEYPDYHCLESCSTDWSGIFTSIGVGYRFE
ncbi:porin family protein [Candidatus Aerophobetes bacterium]|uniref:Porin family protein n=1 Tax=Aerophobetes bacterium TaxID=2030807 RepID=A0A523S5V7_UNCAE|nr:MAG: porin family protein [Candidatus Aerophobetes bacterium]